MITAIFKSCGDGLVIILPGFRNMGFTHPSEAAILRALESVSRALRRAVARYRTMKMRARCGNSSRANAFSAYCRAGPFRPSFKYASARVLVRIGRLRVSKQNELQDFDR